MTKRSLKSEMTNRVSLMGDSCQKEECEASGKPKAVRSGLVFEVSGDLAQCPPAAKDAFAGAEEPKTSHRNRASCRSSHVGQVWESKSEAANDARGGTYRACHVTERSKPGRPRQGFKRA